MTDESGKKKRKSNAAVSLSGAMITQVSGLSVHGGKVGLRVEDTNLQARDLRFHDVETPIELSRSTADIQHVKSTDSVKNVRSQVGITGSGPAGKRYQKGPSIPCYCSNCERVFPSATIHAFNSEVYIKHTTETCPYCKFDKAEVARGQYWILRDIAVFMEGPDASRQHLDALNRVLNALSNDEEASSQDIETVDAIKPGMYKKLTAFRDEILNWAAFTSVILVPFLAYGTYWISQDEDYRECIGDRSLVNCFLEEYLYPQSSPKSPLENQIETHSESDPATSKTPAHKKPTDGPDYEQPHEDPHQEDPSG